MLNQYEFIDKWLKRNDLVTKSLSIVPSKVILSHCIEVTVLKNMCNTISNYHVEYIVRKYYKENFNIIIPRGYLMMN